MWCPNALTLLPVLLPVPPYLYQGYGAGVAVSLACRKEIAVSSLREDLVKLRNIAFRLAFPGLFPDHCLLVCILLDLVRLDSYASLPCFVVQDRHPSRFYAISSRHLGKLVSISKPRRLPSKLTKRISHTGARCLHRRTRIQVQWLHMIFLFLFLLELSDSSLRLQGCC